MNSTTELLGDMSYGLVMPSMIIAMIETNEIQITHKTMTNRHLT